jgi:hypothetical protein
MLFLLGFEAITTYSNSLTDSILIPKNVYTESTGDINKLKYIDEIYDKIYSYLSLLGPVENNEDYLRFNCYGLKITLNDITGTDNNRVIPVIFKNDINRNILTTNNTSALYNEIIEIFSTAGDKQSTLCDTYKLLDYKAMYSYALGVLYGCLCLGYEQTSIWTIPPFFWYNGEYTNLVNTAWLVFRFHHSTFIPEVDDNVDHADWSYKYKGIVSNRLWNYDQLKPSIELMIDELFCSIVSIKQTTVNNLLIEESIESNPIMYSKLLNGIPYVSVIVFNNQINSYSLIGGIRDNAYVEWHFNNYSITSRGSTLINNSTDRLNYITINYKYNYKVHYDNDEQDTVIPNIVFENTVEIKNYNDDNIVPPGKYKFITADDSTTWHNIADYIISENNETGVINPYGKRIIKYIADYPVIIFKAVTGWQNLSYDETNSNIIKVDEYLSPKNKPYFIVTGNLGWCNYKNNSTNLKDMPVSIINLNENTINTGIGIYLLYNKHIHSIDSAYKCKINNNDNSDNSALYGLFYDLVKDNNGKPAISFQNANIPSAHKNESLFKSVISNNLICDNDNNSRLYKLISELPAEDIYTLETQYDLNLKLNVYIRTDGVTKYIWAGPDSDNDILLTDTGYSDTESIAIDAYTSDPESTTPLKYDLRYNSKTGNYWSSKVKAWHTRDTFTDCFTASDKTTSLYCGTTKIFDSANIYYNYKGNDCIYCDNKSLFNGIGFYDIALELHQYYGVTPYLCEIIYKDDNGKPLVWYDKYNDTPKYWNGFQNRWQTNKPSIPDEI